MEKLELWMYFFSGLCLGATIVGMFFLVYIRNVYEYKKAINIYIDNMEAYIKAYEEAVKISNKSNSINDIHLN